MSERVRDMFAEISGTYDKANSALSLGVHHIWRKRTVSESGVRAGDTVLDCATGTGDLAIEFKKAVGPAGRVVGTDFCDEMLVYAVAKTADSDMPIEWETQDVLKLPYADATFHVSSIAFGIRNVDDPVLGLKNMARVVKPGGRVLVLEFGTPLWYMKPFFSFYSKVVIPLLGGLISGKQEAYSYLTRTSAAFPTGDAFLKLMDETGMFSSRKTIPLTGGIAYLYVGIVK
jgi:demethylmenaquinone methyltransferase/2-methoxy-6-polyprenyl-1,4-benzoquinol methylase